MFKTIIRHYIIDAGIEALFDNIISNFNIKPDTLLKVGNYVWVGEVIEGSLFETALGKIVEMNEYIIIVLDEDTTQYVTCSIEDSIIHPYEFSKTFSNDFDGYSDQDIIDILNAGLRGGDLITAKPNTDYDYEDDDDD